MDSTPDKDCVKKKYQGDRVKVRTRRAKKRRVYRNQYSKSKDDQDQSTTVMSNDSISPSTPTVDKQLLLDDLVETAQNSTASASKVENVFTDTPTQRKPITGYRLIDVEILSSVFGQVGCCPSCGSRSLSLSDNVSNKKGLASSLHLKCTLPTCDYSFSFYTSARTTDKTFDLNNRIVYAMRNIGQGHSSLEQFTTLMNMPRPMTKKNFSVTNKKVLKAASLVAEQTMIDATQDLKSSTHSSDVSVSVDGAWQRRGYASFNGLVAVISVDSGKILDVEAMSRFCKACRENEGRNKDDYDEWYEGHKNDCTLNSVGSAGNMEVVGAKRIFGRSLEKRELRYTKYLGDGDSKSHLSVKNCYDGIEVEKLECVGHVQKRVGCRLRKLKKTQKNLGGKGKLTDSIVDRLQNYYGIAIRSNIGNLEGMKKAIHASLFHVASSSENVWHDHCPDGENSWCQFKRDEFMGTNSYVPGSGLPLEVIKYVKPIFNDLSQDSLLKSCLHGRTQNANESFNSVVWKRVPKSTFVTLPTFKLGVLDAVSHFNIGMKAAVLVFEQLGMVPGQYMTKGCAVRNKKRLFNAAYKHQESAKKRRKILRGRSKNKGDKNKEVEGPVYKAGSF